MVIPAWDQQLGTLTWCIDQALRAVGGAPTYLLTDNARTVTVDHVAGIAVRHPEMVALGRYYPLQDGDLRSVRPGVQGRGRGDGEDRQG